MCFMSELGSFVDSVFETFDFLQLTPLTPKMQQDVVERRVKDDEKMKAALNSGGANTSEGSRALRLVVPSLGIASPFLLSRWATRRLGLRLALAQPPSRPTGSRTHPAAACTG